MRSIDFSNKKTLIGTGIVVFILLFAGIFAYFHYYGSQNDISEKEEDVRYSVEEGSISIKEIYLLERKPGRKEETSKFEPQSYLEIKGKFSIREGKGVKFHLLDEEKNILEEDFLPSITEDTLSYYRHEEDEEFSRCCGTTPQKEGNYYVGIFDEEVQLKNLPFTVIETEDQ